MACFAAGHACLSFNMPQHRHLWDVLSRWCHELSLICVCERGKQKVKAVNVKYFEVAWFAKHFPSLLLTVWSYTWTRHLVQHANEVVLMAMLLLLPKRLSALLSAARSSTQLAVDPPAPELGSRWKLWTVESCEEFRTFSSLSMQSVYSTLWSVLPGMLRYSDAWPFITKSHDQTDRVLSSIVSPYVQFNHSTDAGRPINRAGLTQVKFIQFVLTFLTFSVKRQYRAPKGCSIFDKVSHVVVLILQTQGCGIRPSCSLQYSGSSFDSNQHLHCLWSTKISLWIYLEVWNHRVWLIYWYDDNGMLAAGASWPIHCEAGAPLLRPGWKSRISWETPKIQGKAKFHGRSRIKAE